MDLKEYLKSFDSVVFVYELGEGDFAHIPCKVNDVFIETFYFEEKREPLFFSVNLTPLETEEDLMSKYNISREDWESIFLDVSLDFILKY